VLNSRRSRLIGLLGTVAAVASLVGIAVSSTGAYFTDSKPGAIIGNLGTVAVDVSGENINFANLMPGTAQTQTVTVHNTGTDSEDIYLVFDNDNFAWSAVNDLGQYGKFVINGQTYDNLNNRYEATNPGVPGTGTGTTGPCGTAQIPVNYLPHAIKLGTLSTNQVWTFDITFEFNACLSDPAAQGATLWGAADSNFPTIAPAPLNFVVAAFQPGVDPTSNFNGTGKIVPLSLPISGDTRSPAGTFQ
jgi:hypothetical protein